MILFGPYEVSALQNNEVAAFQGFWLYVSQWRCIPDQANCPHYRRCPYFREFGLRGSTVCGTAYGEHLPSTTRTFLAFEAHQARSGKACKTASQSDSLHVLMSANYEINLQNVDTSPIPSLLPAFNIACGKQGYSSKSGRCVCGPLTVLVTDCTSSTYLQTQLKLASLSRFGHGLAR